MSNKIIQKQQQVSLNIFCIQTHLAMPIYGSDSDDHHHSTSSRLFGRQRSLHQILGGGKVADILLWRRKEISASVLVGSTTIWFLFQIADYNFVSLLCHITILAMLCLFVWYSGAGFANWSPPDIRRVMIPESTFRWLLAKINWFLIKFYEISSGRDFRKFVLAITSLWIVSVIGNFFSSLNLLYLGVLFLETVPALYERYEEQVDELATRGNRDAKKLYKKFDSKVLNKIPRGPVKEKRFK